MSSTQGVINARCRRRKESSPLPRSNLILTDHGREELIQKLAARHIQLLWEGLAEEPVTLDEIEQRVEEIGRAVEAELERRLLQRRLLQRRLLQHRERACWRA